MRVVAVVGILRAPAALCLMPLAEVVFGLVIILIDWQQGTDSFGPFTKNASSKTQLLASNAER